MACERDELWHQRQRLRVVRCSAGERFADDGGELFAGDRQSFVADGDREAGELVEGVDIADVGIEHGWLQVGPRGLEGLASRVVLEVFRIDRVELCLRGGGVGGGLGLGVQGRAGEQEGQQDRGEYEDLFRVLHVMFIAQFLRLAGMIDTQCWHWWCMKKAGVGGARVRVGCGRCAGRGVC